MLSLPPELITIIATNISKITDKRQYTQTCNTYNNLTKPLILNQETTLKIEHFGYPKYNCVEKFTLEICNDSYFSKIPICYLNQYNNIIVKALTIYGQIELLEIALGYEHDLFKEIDDSGYGDPGGNNNSCVHAIISGNIDMLVFVRLHGCEWDEDIFDFAAKCNHLHMLKFLKKYGCEIGEYASSYAEENGNTEMMDWLTENNLIIM